MIPKQKDPKESKIINDMNKYKKIAEEKGKLKDVSFVSTIPESLYSTPRENPLVDLKKVDLTLSANINKADLKTYLINWISESKFLKFIFKKN